MTLEDFILEADRRGFYTHSLGEYHDRRPERERPKGWEVLEGWRVSLYDRATRTLWCIGYGSDFHLAFQRALDEIEPATQRMSQPSTTQRSIVQRPARPTLDDLLGELK